MEEKTKEGDNGELKRELTSEEMLADKKKAFEANPDMFVDLSEVIVVVKRAPGGVSHWIGSARRSEYNIAKSEVQYQIDKILNNIDMEVALKSKGKIHIPGKGAFGKGLFKR